MENILTKYLNYKYERTTICKMPNSMPAGYQTTCDTDLENKSAEDCISLTQCANDYADNSTYHPLSLHCDSTGADFRFSGCYPLDDLSDNFDDETIDDPTDDQLAIRIIENHAQYWFDPNASGAILKDATDKVEKITSVSLKRNPEGHEAIRVDPTKGPVLETRGDIKYLKFSGDDGERLKNSNIIILGISYKKNIDDLRESPSLEIIDLLIKKDAVVNYCDPFFEFLPTTRRFKFDLKGVELTKENLIKADAVILAADHDIFDYELIKRFSKLIIDTRGRFIPSDNIIRG